MLDKLEKLINEHGSANILRERLGLKDDQIASIQREFSDAIKKHSALERENENLKTSLEQAHQEINRLNKIVETYTKTESIPELGKIPLDIVEELFEANEERTAESIASRFGLKVGIAIYHLDNLMEIGLISRGPIIIDEPKTYLINKAGRKYVAEMDKM